MSLTKLKYYDHPEGQDFFGKMMATNRYALTFGLAWASYDVLMYTKPKGYFGAISRYGYWCGPLMGMATAFTLTTYAATHLRQKDDRWNYFAGAISSAGIYGMWQRSVVGGVAAIAVFGIAAALKKQSIQEGWEFFPEVKQHGMGSATSARTHDFTLMKDYPKTWTNGKEESS